MNFPAWDVPLLGGGLLIGLVAILHVFVAHFAVGGGLFLVWTEARAYRKNDPALLEYVKRHSSFFVLLVLVFGAVSGVGIWWTIGLVHPPATSTLIHTFVWGWAIEWVFFFVEIAAAFVYYYGWDRLDRRTHLAVGWIYFGAAWLSLFVINGILTFMLTPGRWLASGSFADGFFNPTMLPSAVIRTASAVALAGLYALVTASRVGDEALRHRVTRYAAGWILAGALVLPFAGPWYISIIPSAAREISMGGAAAVTIFAGMSIALSALIVAIAFLGPFRRPDFSNPLLVSVMVVLGLGVTGVTEWVREAVRKPYVIYGYMYSNGIRVQDVSAISQAGVLQVAKWAGVTDPGGGQELRAGAEIFRIECRSCHTVDGYNAIRPFVKGWREEFVDYQLQRLSELKGFMPPFIGRPVERRALARWLAEVGRSGPFSTPVAQARAEDASAGTREVTR
jgi:cytochrome bd-type quinol oxidase subunit 1